MGPEPGKSLKAYLHFVSEFSVLRRSLACHMEETAWSR